MEPNILSVVPIVITIVLAIATKNVLVSLFTGMLTGVFIIVGGNPVLAVQSAFSDYVLPQFLDSYNAGILLLLVFIGGFVTLVEKSGGAEAFARSVSNLVNTRKKTQIAAWLGGIFVFFSDLGTPLIVGPVFTSIFQKMRISKEKLAWILDTTASPVCAMIPFIGWGVTAMSVIQDEFNNLGITDITDWTAIIRALPYQIYPILCIIMVPLVAFGGREFGAMAKAEQNAVNGVFSKSDSQIEESQNMILNNHVSPLIVVIPLAVLFLIFFGILIPQGFPVAQMSGSAIRLALMTGYFFAAITLIVLMKYYKVQSFKGGIKLYLGGTSKLFDCMAMLVLAWALNSVGNTLGTSVFIVETANGTVPAWAVPVLIFIIASIVSLATGTSWGTFAIIIPIAIQMAVALGAPLFVTIGAVIAGGLFGDHCSPVSDTTILASIGANCPLVGHTWTQLPYALICAVISAGGFIAAGIFESVFATVGCVAALVVVYIIIGRLKGVSIPNLTAEEIEKMDNAAEQ